MENKHFDVCEGVICAADTTENYKKDVAWFPGEQVCGRSPAQKFQRIQRRINLKVAKGTFKNPSRYFTAEMLEKMTKVMNGSKGRNPDV